jgi:hypothetical protein
MKTETNTEEENRLTNQQTNEAANKKESFIGVICMQIHRES